MSLLFHCVKPEVVIIGEISYISLINEGFCDSVAFK